MKICEERRKEERKRRGQGERERGKERDLVDE